MPKCAPGPTRSPDSRMHKTDIQTLFDYVYWANRRLLDAAQGLSPAQLAATTAVTTRDLRATLVHELDVEWSWRLNLQGRLSDDEADLRPEDYPDVAAIREHWRRDEAEMRSWLGSLSDDEVAGDVYSGLTDNSLPLWQFLLHIVFHASQQQADAATLLTLAGRSPGDLGFLEFLRVNASRADRPDVQPHDD
jgi:uncharacterized damage-inducible protein DinB